MKYPNRMRLLGSLCLALLTAGALGCVQTRTAAKPEEKPKSSYPRAKHKVRRGETLWSIATKYKTTVQALRQLNRLPDNTITIGQYLAIPGVKTVRQAGRRSLNCSAYGNARPGRPVSKDGHSWPTDGVISTRFGSFEGRPFKGITISAVTGTPVWASKAGTVILQGLEPGFGRVVVLKHDDETLTLYGHLDRPCVNEGLFVQGGELIGLVGSSGRAATPRLYFEVVEGERKVDPETRLPPDPRR